MQLARRLRDRDPNTTPPLRWLNDRLAAEGTTTDEIVREEVQSQSAINVTVRNVITSMRLVSTINWAEFFESVSPVDAVLRGSSGFAAMDFPTRDLYRRAIEQLARQSDCDEIEVAIRALAAAKRAGAGLGDHRTACRECDPGYYLIANGRRTFEKELGCRIPIRTRLFRLNSNIGVMSYVGMIALVTAIVMGTALLATSHAGFHNWIPLLLLAIAGMVPASDVAVAVVNRAITRGVGARLMPGLEFRQGVPADRRTIIVVPAMLASIPEIRNQVERLEVHYLSNPDENLVFAILSDWRDSETEHDANDEPLLAEAAAGIAKLNARHADADGAAPILSSSSAAPLERRRGKMDWLGTQARQAA